MRTVWDEGEVSVQVRAAHQGEGVKVLGPCGCVAGGGVLSLFFLSGITSGLYMAANLYKQAFVYCLATVV